MLHASCQLKSSYRIKEWSPAGTHRNVQPNNSMFPNLFELPVGILQADIIQTSILRVQQTAAWEVVQVHPGFSRMSLLSLPACNLSHRGRSVSASSSDRHHHHHHGTMSRLWGPYFPGNSTSKTGIKSLEFPLRTVLLFLQCINKNTIKKTKTEKTQVAFPTARWHQISISTS